MLVLDSSFFIEDRSLNEGEKALSTPGVRDELEDASRFRFDATEGQGMRVETPSDDAVREVRNAARETGDASVLSEVDVRLVALAYEEDAELVTDDYAMQNVASRLGVGTRGAGKDKIEEERDWRYRCVGCGRVYDEKKRCDVCGSETTRKNPS
ncbi:MAG: NOB1 family endonuclease [Halobacteria archaeon]